MHPTATHKRIYQACDNCRIKRVRCQLGSVDQPQDPPCARCRRESKPCYFSSTRNKRAKIDHDHTLADRTSSDIRQNEDQSLQNESDIRTGHESMQHGYSPRSGNGKTANSDLDPGAESSDGQQTVSTLLDRQAYTTNDALDLLHEAAQHGKSAIATETSAGSMHGSSNWHSSPTKSGLGKGRGAIDVALKSWCTLLFVRDGLLTAEEALSYVDWFYNSLAPLSPIPWARFQNHSQHKNLLEKEPILAVTMLTLASRYMKLSGPGAITRGFVIHDRLWNYLRGMISRVFWSEETFTSMDQVSHSETMFPGSPDTRPSTPSSVLRTMGTCEALLLLLEWYPRTLHFPPADNDINSIIVRDGTSNYMTSQGRYGRLRSGVDWLKRSDRMAWSLLGLAQSLATELGMFDKKDTSTDSHNHQFEEDMQRACRIKQLIWVFSIQTSGRLGWKYLPIFSISKQNGHNADDNTECWEGIASLLKKGHELLFSSSHNTMEIVSKRQYHPLLQILQAHLEDWRRIYEAAKLTKLMRSMLGIEYEYVRLYAYSIVLQSVVERRKEKGSIGEKSLNAEDEQDSDVLYDKLYLGYLTDAARSLLGIVVDDLFARGYLQYIPVRPYSRILAAALYLLKTSAIEMKEGEVRKSLSLVNRTAEALQSSMVDDIHLGPHWGVLLANLSSSISARATKSATQGSEMAQRLPIDSEASRYRSAHQDKIQPEHTSNPTTNSSSYATSLTSQPGTLNSIEHTNMYNFDSGQSSLNADPAELNYDEMFLWPDPLSQISEIDMTQVPWNGDQAMFQILASVVDSEIK